MFISGNTVQALLRDSLYLTQVGDQFQYERHNVSQLVTIDISDVAQPRVVSTLDIKGELREGVSRKIENTIYVVSYFPQNYYWGWRPDPAAQKEQAWVYSFNVADPAHPVEKGRHKIFEGGSINEYDPARGTSVNRNFSGVAISATANALMVVENWWLSWSDSGGSGGSSGCGQSYYSGQEAVVSLIDISDPQGNIAEHARFRTTGQLNDQFKMTYVHDAAASTGTFYGIFNRQIFSSTGCNWQQQTQNTLESWDVSQRGKPRRLDTLDFGKPNETVRGSAFDVERKVAYAITAERIDPMYALGFADRADLKKLSEIDGLSGDIGVFRLVGDRQFLLAVGQDNSETCQGLQVGGRTPTRMAVSVIDVRDLAAIRLVQRQCVAIEGADWVGSGVSNNLDQAHKMLGMHADGDLNVLSVPVYYSKRLDSGLGAWWWWYSQETAVGLMTWDLRNYDPARPAAEQQVIQNFGSFIHPHGEVRRSILFRHKGPSDLPGRRMMINLSDTHASIVDLEDLRSPQLQSTIELAPYYNQVYRFGDYLVEQVQPRPSQSWWSPTQDLTEFRVRRAGGDLESSQVLAKFEAAQLQRVFKHGENLVLFRQQGSYGPNGEQPTTDVQVVDLRDPAHPRQAGRLPFPAQVFSYYYPYWCGMGGYWNSYWFGQQTNFALTDQGIAFYVNDWDNRTGKQRNDLVFLDLRNPDSLRVTTQHLDDEATWGSYGLVADPVEPRGFYVSHRKQVGTVSRDGQSFDQFRFYAQRWEPSPDGSRWTATRQINIPGTLIRTWKAADGTRMLLSQDHQYRWVALPSPQQGTELRTDARLSLMRQITLASGQPAAEFLDGRAFTNLNLGALMLAGDNQDRLVIGAQPVWNWYGYGDSKQPAPTWQQTSDRLLVFDLSGGKLNLMYEQPTRMYGLSLMGTHKGKLFVNISASGGFYTGGWSWVSGTGDGILVVDLSAPASPKATRFVRTLGYASHIEFFDDEAYIASGHFGLLHLDLRAPADIPIE
jgi:hypothetical protein